MVVTGTYNPHLVALSILVAAFASYTALDLGGRVAAARGVAPRMWLVPPAIAMGGGIWSMHFIAMLAFNMPTSMSYDIGLTTLSLVVAILVTGAGFYFINHQSQIGLIETRVSPGIVNGAVNGKRGPSHRRVVHTGNGQTHDDGGNELLSKIRSSECQP